MKICQDITETNISAFKRLLSAYMKHPLCFRAVMSLENYYYLDLHVITDERMPKSRSSTSVMKSKTLTLLCKPSIYNIPKWSATL